MVEGEALRWSSAGKALQGAGVATMLMAASIPDAVVVGVDEEGACRNRRAVVIPGREVEIDHRVRIRPDMLCHGKGKGQIGGRPIVVGKHAGYAIYAALIEEGH